MTINIYLAESVVHIAEHIKYDISEYQNISTWLSAIEDRKAFQSFKALCD